MQKYILSLMEEAKKYRGVELQSVYIGGGTPTFLEKEQLKLLLHFIKKEFNIADQAEWTIEANPDDITKEKLLLLKECGINRISLGVQTFNDHYLKSLGRIHTANTAKKAFALIREAGFKNVNVDLMFGFMDQSILELGADLNELTSLNSEHVSLYALTVEENSRFFAEGKMPSNEEHLASMYSRIIDSLKAHGLNQYEVSNFAREGFESKHNLHYWQGGDYIGLGIGAHSHHSGKRSWNLSRLAQYIKNIESKDNIEEGFEDLTPKQQFMERLLFGLRMNEGVNMNSFRLELNKLFDDQQKKKFDRYIKEGFLVKKDNRLIVSDKGRLVLDELSSQLI